MKAGSFAALRNDKREGERAATIVRWPAHRRLGLGYLGLALVAVVVGTLLSVLMRLHRVWPELAVPLLGVLRPEQYLQFVTMHGTLMVFFVLTVAPQSGFANLVLPEQLGGRAMALPLVNALGFWGTAVSLGIMLLAFLVPGGGPMGGWSAYPPLSVLADAGPGQALGMDVWLLSLAVFCVASSLGAVNTVVTVMRCRCEGMTYGRMPMTVWGWLTAALLTVLVFSVLFAALVLLGCDRHLGTAFFVPSVQWVNGVVVHRSGDGSPLLWLHLFWFFGHPEVYIAILPGMGLVTMLLGNFTERRIPGYRMMILTTLLIGGMGVLVWGHHMFVAGLNPFAGTAFELTTMAIALPSVAKVLNWLAILWRSRRASGLRFATPMLWALGFVSVFVAGGVTGPILAQPALDAYLHNTFFVVAHFHLIMAMAAIFGIFAGVSYWFPLVVGRHLGEELGKVHFWWTLFFAYNTFLPMHLTGLAGEPRHYAQLTGLMGTAGALVRGTIPLERHITASALLLAVGQVLWVWNVAWSWRRGRVAGENPWRATTMEWAPGSGSGGHGKGSLPDREARVWSRRTNEDGAGAAVERTEVRGAEVSCEGWGGTDKGGMDEAGGLRCYREPCHYESAITGEGQFLPQWAAGPVAE